MAKVIKLKDEKNNLVVEAKKGSKGYLDFYCPCGSEMWNNISKKKSGEISNKGPDLKCKDDDCPHKSGKFTYAMWLNDEQKKQLGFNSGDNKGRKSSSGFSSSRDYGNGIPVSMYSAWAKDFALYLAKETKVKEWDELMALYDTCLKGTEDVLKKYTSKLDKADVKEIEEEDSLEIGEPEDVEEPDDTEDDEDSIDVSDDEDSIDLSELDNLEI